MKHHKKSGKVAVFQTRDEAAREALARSNDNPETFHPDNVHEVVREGDTFVGGDGRRVVHDASAVTQHDIRIVVPNEDGTYAYVGPWNKAGEKEKMQKDWDAAN